MKQSDQIQINYEDQARFLTDEIETYVRYNLFRLLEKTGNSDRVISLYFCSLATIQSLNKDFRGMDKPTDILAWSYEGDDMSFPEADIWGELAICIDICQKQADESGWPLETELLRLLAHGLCHLMGHDHELSDEDEKRMLELEISLLSSINLGGLYD
jgi:probable rRNA maturation factor